MTVWFRALAIAILPIGAMAQGFFGGHPKIAPDLQEAFPEDKVDVIVQYKSNAFEQIAGAARARHARIRELQDKGPLRSIHSEVLTVRAVDLALIADDPDVEFISPDRPVGSMDFSGSPDYGWIVAGAKTAM